MDKGSKLMLGLYKIWVCSPQLAYINYTHLFYKRLNLKECYW